MPLSAQEAPATETASIESAPGMGIGVAAVVDDAIVSTLDVENRMALVLTNAGIGNDPATRDKVRPQVIRMLIDEVLQNREVSRQGIRVTDEEIALAIANIEKRSNKPEGSLLAHLNRNGVPASTLFAQLRAQIGWTKYIMRNVRPRILIGKDELQIAKEKLAGDDSDIEWQVASLLLPVDKPENEDSVQQLASKLVQEVRGGASFDAVSTQFRGDAEGNAIWVRPADMEPSIAAELQKISKGQVTEPIRVPQGYQILHLRDSREVAMNMKEAELLFKQVTIALPPTAKPTEGSRAFFRAEDMREQHKSCTEEKPASGESKDVNISYSRVMLSSLSPQLRPILEPLKVGEVSEPYATPEGYQFVVLCERITIPAKLPPDDKIRERLVAERLGLESEKLMRNLRQSAFIDVRL
jgi:peptidyl-prolyl cis-trans isomerase SurA